MSLFYVTGISGSGKSEVLEELKVRGYEAYGIDENGFADWVNKSNGGVEALPQNRPNFDIHRWFREHYWVLNSTKIARLMKRSSKSDNPIFLCGLADGEDKVWHMFTKLFLLTIDNKTLEQRITQRIDNDFGKNPAEMHSIFEWLSKNEKRYQRLGAIPIDATQPVVNVVDEIIANL